MQNSVVDRLAAMALQSGSDLEAVLAPITSPAAIAEVNLGTLAPSSGPEVDLSGLTSGSAIPPLTLSPPPARAPISLPSRDPLAGPSEPPAIDPAQLMQWHLARKFDDIALLFRNVLMYYYNHPFEMLTPEIEAHVNLFVGNLLYFLAQPDFLVPNDAVEFFITFNPVLNNLVAASAYRTTDPQLAQILNQPNNYVKILMLYSLRNTTTIDAKIFFDKEPNLASIWYTVNTLNVAGWTSQLTYDNGRRHVLELDDRLEARDENVAHMYFACTYIDPQRDRLIKEQYNRSLQRRLANVVVRNHPRRDSIGILTAKWFPASAVHRSAYPLIAALREKYRLTLVHLGDMPLKDIDTSLFDEVRCLNIKGGNFDASTLDGNDFQMAYYPDVGMTGESIWLSNLRIAPIQVVSYGHPVSTYGSRIDYFLGGQDAELPDHVLENYSERMVLIPGLAAVPTYPVYALRHPTRAPDTVRINCPWSFVKINYPWLLRLKEIAQRADKRVNFQFFPGGGATRFGSVLPLVRDLGTLLTGVSTYYTNRTYADYMAGMELGELGLESHPFGGYNTIVDLLHLGQPVVTLEGTRFYDRCASGLLRKLGLDELVCATADEYVEKTVYIVNNDRYRYELSNRIKTLDLRAKLYDTDEPRYFLKAIDFLMDNHETLKNDGSRAPIYIH